MNESLTKLANRFSASAPAVDFWTLRLTDEHREFTHVRQGVPQPVSMDLARGALLTVFEGDGMGYAATSDLSPSGLQRAAGQARDWAKSTQGRGLIEVGGYPRPAHQGRYQTPVAVALGKHASG